MNILSAARLPPEQLTAALASLTNEEAEALLHDWSFLGRDDQQPPPGDWDFWLFLAGRGAGKTRAGAEWIRAQVKAGKKRIGLIAPTSADLRAVMIEGPSGILSCAWENDLDYRGKAVGIPRYEPSKRHRLTWANGAIAQGFSAEEPERLRGPQHEIIWADELAAWKEPDAAWDMALFGLRLGQNPRALITTTPKPIPIIRELVRGETSRVVITRSHTGANSANLADTFLRTITSKYVGTRLGRQELEGELIEDVEGALWTRATIEKSRLPADAKVPDILRMVVAVDPAAKASDAASLCGIVVAGLGADGNGYLLEDVSLRASPAKWGATVADAFERRLADAVVAEGNQGGEMVRHTINGGRSQGEVLPIKIVHASESKRARAEPISMLYEQGRIRHAGAFPELEDQMCTWEPLSGQPSPDRLDAMVWAFTELMLGGSRELPVPSPIMVTAATGRTSSSSNAGDDRGDRYGYDEDDEDF